METAQAIPQHLDGICSNTETLCTEVKLPIWNLKVDSLCFFYFFLSEPVLRICAVLGGVYGFI